MKSRVQLLLTFLQQKVLQKNELNVQRSVTLPHVLLSIAQKLQQSQILC